ncbi:DUF397 domain-containing protein [Streptomyces fuscichromogenes]|uniref:DUF397 domain-containing protein n=1 Tax=Streptomyces fuscichromogenes TaxID=1324013 RepID=A0A918CW56_9ACTN|nr:DUF397 domain-containing protein [Streptomyces fuscichromogenes]GGN37317.1 hypothetical protein GCM10011578_081450 [Streptomyces fuscichromogenes]
MGKPPTKSKARCISAEEGGTALAGDLGAVVWWKSSHSGNDDDNCCEIAVSSGRVRVRDSKHPEAARLSFAPAAWLSALPMFLTPYGAGQDHG